VRARENPFAVQRLDALAYRLRGESWESLLARLAWLRRRAAIVGPEGHGKTTLLEELARRLARDGLRLRWLRLRHGEGRAARHALRELTRGVDGDDLLLVDGAQELGPLAWRRLRWRSRAAGGLLVTSHRPGLLPTLIECRTSVELLAELLRELDPAATVPLPSAAELLDRHGGNVRAALLAAYDIASEVT